MRTRSVAVVLGASVVYAMLGELHYQGDRRVRDVFGQCVDAPVTYAPVALAIGLVAFVVSSGLVARAAPGAWKRTTARSAALALVVGGGAGLWWYGTRMARGGECAMIRYCVWCEPAWWQHDAVSLAVLAAAGAFLSLPVGWAARRIGRSPRA